MKTLFAYVLAAISALAAAAVAAADVSLSGFGTAGYALSDQGYNYQRFINKQGTFKRDSVLGVQMDGKLNDEFGFTVQGKLAPSIDSDKDVDATVSWAFLSWRPNNDWLVRLGRVRVPLYLNSENMEVGATFDFARLPVEMYTTSQATEGDGLFLSKTWNLDIGELTLNGYSASAYTNYRFYRRDDVPPLLSAGAYFIPVKITSSGLVLVLQHEDNAFRVGAHDTYTQITDDKAMPVTFPYVALMPGVGYYQTTSLLPGPGVPDVTRIHGVAYTLGADVTLDNGFRVMGEYVRRDVRNIASGPDSQGGYLALLKSMGAWTPYIGAAYLVSMPRTRDLYNKVNSNTFPGSTTLNATQRAGADGIIAYDQSTWTLGTSYRLTPTSKLKAEWARTRVGDVTNFIDAPPGGDSGKKTVNVFSFSYSVVF